MVELPQRDHRCFLHDVLGLGPVAAGSARVLAANPLTRVYFQPIAGGSGGADLVVTINASADTTATTALLRNITYENTDIVAPTLGARTVRYTVSDGDGDTSLNHDATVTVSASAPPVITNLAGDTLAYNEDDPASVIEQGVDVTVTAGDSADFDTGNLTLSIFAGGVPAEDILAIRDQGPGVGNISVVGVSVSYDFGAGPVLIGTAVGGAGGADLVVTFNASADATATDALIENVTYQNTDTGAPTISARTVRFMVTDGDGGVSATYDTTATVSLLNDAPVLDNTGAMTLSNINEDDFASSGDTVANVVLSAGGTRITDVGAVKGIAVIGVDDTNGTWQYDAGSGFTPFSAVTGSNAVLLDPTALIRFVPDPDYNGSAGTITLRA